MDDQAVYISDVTNIFKKRSIENLDSCPILISSTTLTPYPHFSFCYILILSDATELSVFVFVYVFLHVSFLL